VGFFADGSLKRIDINGGSVAIVAKAPIARGGTWNGDDTIVFAPAAVGPLFRVRATGSEPSAVTRLDAPREANHRYPQFLPDGQHFLYYVTGSPEVRGIYLGQLDGSAPRRLLDADTAAAYTSSGQLLFVRQDTLFAQSFDPIRLVVTGDPYLVAQQVAQGAAGAAPGLGAVSTSVAGPVAYRTGSAGRRQLAWFDRSGREIGKVGYPDSTYGPVLSPDGRRVALSRTVNGNTDIWLLELERGITGRLTFDAAVDSYPVWGPDGSRIVFQTSRNGVTDLYEKPINGARGDEPLLANSQSKLPYDWSPDGRFLLYRDVDTKTGWDLWAFPREGDRKPFLIARTEFDERDAQFAPDSKWIAYQSNESGQFEIYVQPFPGPGGKKQVSTSGGAQVRWRHDGNELFYVSLDEQLMAVPVRRTSGGEAIDFGAPTPLFRTRVGGAVPLTYRPHYMVSSDGRRFLVSTVTEETGSPITIMLNWAAGLRK
jgi:Tol biopolymer transport system component